MRIDSHQHFWRYNPQRDGWITDEMAALKRDCLPEELLATMRASGVDACVAVQADQSEAETRFLLDLAARHREIVGVVGWVDLRDPELETRLAEYARYPKLRGFRHIVQAESDDRFLLRQDFLQGVERLASFGFTYDVLIYARHLHVANEYVLRLSEPKLVVDHLAKPAIKDKELSTWTQGMRMLARNRNVYCKLSGMVTEANWANWKVSDLKPYLDVVFEAFGIDRLMFGSDWPVCLLAASYAQVKGAIEEYMRGFNVVDKDKVFGLNAAHFYGLPTEL